METPDSDAKWFYVIVKNPGKPGEEVVGFENTRTGARFIPAFNTKDEAKKCFERMPKDLFTEVYDTQALIEEDLFSIAKAHGRDIYLLDKKGGLIKTLCQGPDSPA